MQITLYQLVCVNIKLRCQLLSTAVICLRMSATVEFFKVQYIIIQAILGRKSMKKYSMSVMLLTVRYKSHVDMRTSKAQLLEKGVSMERKTPKIKFCRKKVHHW